MSGKIIFITGAAKGIGRETVLCLLDDGHTVYGSDIDMDTLKTIKNERFRALKVDVTRDKDIEKAIALIVKENGRIDSVIANAGYTLMGAIEVTDMEDVRRQFDVNFFGVVKTIQCALPHMRKAGSGKIIITSSVVANIACPAMAFYPATKHALEAYGNALRMEMQKFGIHVSLVHPGFQNTSLMDASFPTLEKAEANDPDGVYSDIHAVFRNAFTTDFTGGGSPKEIGALMAKIISSPKPKYHYRPGFDSKSGYLLTKIAPWKVFDRVAKKKVLGI